MATNFEYPFREGDTPTQYGYKLLGEDQYAKEHTYEIMAQQGRMESFNLFMEGKFGKFGTMPERMEHLGYDLDSAIMSNESDVIVVEVGGGRGETLLEIKKSYPYLKPWNLILQEFHPDPDLSRELTVMHWDFKEYSPQPVKEALIYSCQHIFHNLSDYEALRLMKKLSNAMATYSKLLIHEFAKNSTYGKMHATMIQLYAGRVRSSREWKEMAEFAGLRLTFEAYPVAGEGLVEMRKIED